METLLILTAMAWLTNIIAWGFYPLEVLKEKYLYEDSLLRIGLSCTKCVGIYIGIFTCLYFNLPLIYIPLISLYSYILEKILK